jgi:hypothetical protein
LARLYGVPTKLLNKQVKRNASRFPSDFMFRLTSEEAEQSQRSRSQFATLKRGQNIKYRPYAFTEHGALMAANILNSPRAVGINQFQHFRISAFSFSPMRSSVPCWSRRHRHPNPKSAFT